MAFQERTYEFDVNRPTRARQAVEAAHARDFEAEVLTTLGGTYVVVGGEDPHLLDGLMADLGGLPGEAAL